MNVFVAVDIGCIECGETSNVIGVFIDEATAATASEEAERQQAENWQGQHGFFVQEVEVA